MKNKKFIVIVVLCLLSLLMLSACGNYTAKKLGDKLDNLERIGYKVEAFNYSDTPLSGYDLDKGEDYLRIYVMDDEHSAKVCYEFLQLIYKKNEMESLFFARDKNLVYEATSERVINDAKQC